MQAFKKLCALFVCLTLILSILFSISVLSHEADHDCIGEECQICAIIGKVSELLDGFGCNFAVFAVLAALSFSVARVFGEDSSPFVAETPVRLKVKLSN